MLRDERFVDAFAWNSGRPSIEDGVDLQNGVTVRVNLVDVLAVAP